MQKKSFLIIFLIFMLIPCTATAKAFDFGVLISSGFNLHTNGDLAKENMLYSDTSAAKILIGTSFDFALRITEPLQLYAGVDSFGDFISKDDFYYNAIDYAFFSGVKIFPGLQGFNFSIAYALGNRSDIININHEEKPIKGTYTAKWGNGFRLAFEYDFFHDSDVKVCPMVGFYYRFMPRGDNHYDNILAAYVGLRF